MTGGRGFLTSEGFVGLKKETPAGRHHHFRASQTVGPAASQVRLKWKHGIVQRVAIGDRALMIGERIRR